MTTAQIPGQVQKSLTVPQTRIAVFKGHGLETTSCTGLYAEAPITTISVTNASAGNGASCGETSREPGCHHDQVTSLISPKESHTRGGTASQEGYIPTESGCLHHTQSSTGEFDLVDVMLDDIEVVLHEVDSQKLALGGTPRVQDELIQVLLNAKALPQPRKWTFVHYTSEEIAAWGPEFYKNEINFERHNYWYPNRLTLPTLNDQVLDLLPKLENGSQTSGSDESLGLGDFSIDLGGGHHWLPMMRLEVRRMKIHTLRWEPGYLSKY